MRKKASSTSVVTVSSFRIVLQNYFFPRNKQKKVIIWQRLFSGDFQSAGTTHCHPPIHPSILFPNRFSRAFFWIKLKFVVVFSSPLFLFCETTDRRIRRRRREGETFLIYIFRTQTAELASKLANHMSICQMPFLRIFSFPLHTPSHPIFSQSHW